MRNTAESPIPGYRIEGVRGNGAMAVVYRAVHEGLNKPVALKVLHDHVASDPEYRERFLREARAAARLNHPNVVRAYEAGEREGTFYFAMEYVEGEDLGERLHREGRLPEGEALAIALEVARALEAAEAHGMVHRDVKPENVLLGTAGRVKLADLGLAKVQGDASVTREGFTLGTVAFFSPEQCRGSGDLDIRSDLYALGALLYATISGELPHGRDENPVLTMERILEEDPAPLGEVAPVSAPTIRCVETLMAKAADQRPPSATAAVALLQESIDRLGRPEGGEPPRRVRRRPRRRTALPRRTSIPLGGLLLGAAILGSVIGFLLIRGSGPDPAGARRQPPGEAPVTTPGAVRPHRAGGGR